MSSVPPVQPAAPALSSASPVTPVAEHAPSKAGRAWLAVEAAGQGILFPLTQAGEIFPPVEITPVAHVQPWFCGVANLRGGLHGVVDLAAFLGLQRPVVPRPAGGRDTARLLAFNPALRAHCALRVDQLGGLRREDELELQPFETARPDFAGALWRDKQGRLWQEMDLAALARSESFLAIAASFDD